MFLTSIFTGITKVINFILDKLPNFDLGTTKLTESLNFIQPKLEVANKIFPVTETLTVLGILISWSIAMTIFWVAQRVINLIRGAG